MESLHCVRNKVNPAVPQSFLRRRLCKNPSLSRVTGGKPNPLNPHCQGDFLCHLPIVRGLVTQFPPDKGGQGGLGMTNIEFLHSLFHRNDGGCGFGFFTGFPLSRLCKKPLLGCVTGGKPNPLNPHCQGDFLCHLPIVRGLVTQFPPDKGGQGGLGMTNIEFLHSLFHRNDGGCGFGFFTGFPLSRLCKKPLLVALLAENPTP